jgi:hypothetical protein
MGQAAWLGCAVGLVIGVSYFFYYDRFSYSLVAGLLLSCYTCLVVFYLVLWLAPNDGKFARRPAMVYWSRFWAIFRTILYCAVLMIFVEMNVGYCVYHVDMFFGYAVLRLWVAYHVFVLEAKFWYLRTLSKLFIVLLNVKEDSNMPTFSSSSFLNLVFSL